MGRGGRERERHCFTFSLVIYSTENTAYIQVNWYVYNIHVHVYIAIMCTV